MLTQKPKLLKVQENVAFSFDIRCEKAPYFDNPWHYHPEIELNLITQSTGIRFVGDSFERFEAGDLVLLGSNLPHYWRNDSAYYCEDSTVIAEAIILRFRADTLGKQLMNLPEMFSISKLFDNALQGFHYTKNIAQQILPLLLKLKEGKGVDQLIIFLEIFKILSQTNDFRALSTKTFGGSKQLNDSERINIILKYIHVHLHENIKIKDIALHINMNPTSFCRYVKSQTNKTFVELLNDIRITNASRMLIDSNKNIAEIAYENGFNNSTHFNYTFKKLKGINPTQYRKSKL